LTYLANRIAQLPIVIVGTYRSGYASDNPALARTLEELIRMGVRPLKLTGLSKNAIAQMLDSLSQGQASENLVSLIFEESQGYPFFVEEVYRHLVEEGRLFDAAGQFRAELKVGESDVPENVRLIISRRLERFDDNEKRALAAAAVIGRSFSFQLLTAVSQIDVDELFPVIEKAQQMGIIVPSSEGPERAFTFRHELVRQTLLAAIFSPAPAANACERRRTRSSGSMLMLLKSAPGKLPTICSKQDRSPTPGGWSIICRSQARMLSKLQLSRRHEPIFVRLCRVRVVLGQYKEPRC
jgi:predicted ATPase